MRLRNNALHYSTARGSGEVIVNCCLVDILAGPTMKFRASCVCHNTGRQWTDAPQFSDKICCYLQSKNMMGHIWGACIVPAVYALTRTGPTVEISGICGHCSHIFSSMLLQWVSIITTLEISFLLQTKVTTSKLKDGPIYCLWPPPFQ